MLCQGDPEKQRIARSEANAPAAGQQELLYGPSGRKRFYERGCQVKTLLLLQEGFVFLGIQPLSMNRTILNARALGEKVRYLFQVPFLLRLPSEDRPHHHLLLVRINTNRMFIRLRRRV
jgi:hypothetical protein